MARLSDHFEQLQKSAQILQRHLAPFAEMQEKIKESLRPVIEAQEQLRQSLQPVAEMQRRAAERVGMLRVPNAFAEELSIIAKCVVEFRRRFEAFVSPALAPLTENFRKLPEKIRNALLVLGDHGWYLDLKMPLPALWELEKALNEGSVDEAERFLVEYFRERVPEITKAFKAAHPHRSKIVEAALAAHARGEYELSIPVFLAQADGICQELIGVQLFKKRAKRPALAAYVEAIAADTLRHALIYPLAHPLPISYAAYERKANFDDLNRHQVLHGESVDYGTEVNSLKGISLLNYVVQILKKDSQENEEP